MSWTTPCLRPEAGCGNTILISRTGLIRLLFQRALFLVVKRANISECGGGVWVLIEVEKAIGVN